MPEKPSQQPPSEGRPDSPKAPASDAPGPIEHLVAREEAAGLVIVGLDAECRAVYTTTLKRRQ
jgi:hypothetical protein